MKRIFTLFLIITVSIVSLGAVARMSDDAAKAKAMTLWGTHASVNKFWSTGQTGQWVMQIGCYDPTNGFMSIGEGISWEAAFLDVDPKKNGPWKVTATARQADGLSTTSTPITFYACNIELKPPPAN